MDYIRLDNQTKEDCHIEENTINDTENLLTNKKKIIKQNNNENNVSQSETEREKLKYIKQKCELYLFEPKQRNIIENALDIMFYSKELKTGQAILPMENVRSRMQLLNASYYFL